MRKSSTTREAAPKTWVRPELVRLGKIADVSAIQGIGPQAGASKS
jgi:hypothetical protein